MSNKYAFLPKCEINMAGYWLSFFQVLWTETKLTSIKKQKNEKTLLMMKITSNKKIKSLVTHLISMRSSFDY